jgi:hypothetical protein
MRVTLALLWAAACFTSPLSAQTPLAPVPTASLAQRPVGDFARLPFMESPALSPDGTRIAAKVNANGTLALAIISLFGKPKPVVIALGDNDLISWTWVNDSWLTIRVGAVDQFLGDDFYVTRIVGVPAAGGKLVPIAFREGGQSADILWTATDGTPRIVMSKQKSIFIGDEFWPDVNEVDVSTGRSRALLTGRTNFMHWVVDPGGAVRMGIGYDDQTRTSKLLYRPDAKASFRILDRADAKKDESLTFPILLSGNATQAVTISDKDGFDALHEQTCRR